jgi:hypothetical protein
MIAEAEEASESESESESDLDSRGSARVGWGVEEAGGDEEPGSELRIIYNSVCSYISAITELRSIGWPKNCIPRHRRITWPSRGRSLLLVLCIFTLVGFRKWSIYRSVRWFIVPQFCQRMHLDKARASAGFYLELCEYLKTSSRRLDPYLVPGHELLFQRLHLLAVGFTSGVVTRNIHVKPFPKTSYALKILKEFDGKKESVLGYLFRAD